eukprot:6184475-Prymnesium_polylepis.1
MRRRAPARARPALARLTRAAPVLALVRGEGPVHYSRGEGEGFKGCRRRASPSRPHPRSQPACGADRPSPCDGRGRRARAARYRPRRLRTARAPGLTSYTHFLNFWRKSARPR